MTKDIYKIDDPEKKVNSFSAKNKIVQYRPSENFTKHEKEDVIKSLKETLVDLVEKVESLEQVASMQPVVNVQIPEVQKVEVTNPQQEQKPVVFPEVQKVEVTNPPQEQKQVVFPDIQKVKIINLPEQPKVPEMQTVSVKGLEDVFKKYAVPTGEGNIPNKADPTKYVSVRLTNGKSFYNALAEAYVAAAKASARPSWNPAPIDSLSNTAVAVKATGGTFGGYYIYNPNSSVAYVQVFDKANPTVGTDAHKAVYAIPATAGANVEIGNGVSYGNAIYVAATTGVANNTGPGTPLVATIYFL